MRCGAQHAFRIEGMNDLQGGLAPSIMNDADNRCTEEEKKDTKYAPKDDPEALVESRGGWGSCCGI